MAANLSQFDVDDDSPEIIYYPFVNLEPSSNVSAGWQLLYSGSGAATGPGEVGVGTSYHYTSLNGASLLIGWNGTGIDLIGSVSNALYNVSLDGTSYAYSSDPANPILASFNDLENTNHELLLTTIVTNATSPDTFLAFDKARITYASPTGSVNTTATSQAITDSDIAFMGTWNYVTDSNGNSMHMSGSAGDQAEVTFSGSAITIYGLTSSYSGNFTVTLDYISTTLSALSSYNNSNSLLFYATDLLQDTPHHLTVTNQENRAFALRVGGVNVTSFGNSAPAPGPLSISTSTSTTSHTIPAGTIAAVVLAVVLFLVIVGIFYYACFMRRKARRITNRHAFLRAGKTQANDKGGADAEQVANVSPPSGTELESTSLSTSKGYGFGLGLRRGFSFGYHKNKIDRNSVRWSPNGIGVQGESHPMTPKFDRNEKRLSVNSLSDFFSVLTHAPESEKLAPGWSNPIARTPSSFKYDHRYKRASEILLPELRMERVGPVEDEDEDEDVDVKTLTSRQDEALAATLSLSPRISEALKASDGIRLGIEARENTRQSYGSQRREFLQVRDTSPFRVDMSAIFGTRKSSRESGSSGTTWSKVRARLYRRAHRDDGRQSHRTDRRVTSGSSGPESVPVVMHEAGSAHPPSQTAPNSFLDLTSSASLRRNSKTTTLSSTPAEVGHGLREVSAWNDSTSIRMMRIERSRDDILPLKPDAPSTVSGGSQPSDHSDSHAVPSDPTTHTQTSSAFPFPVSIPASTHIAPPADHVPERHITPPPPPTLPSVPEQLTQIPQIAPPELALTPPAESPTESVPFSISDIHFRHSASDYAGLDSQRGSASSVLPPHPPLPHLDGSQPSTPTYSPPPPYIVQRVLGLPMSPFTPLSPMVASRMTSNNLTNSVLHGAGRPGTVPMQLTPPARVGSLLGPRPRPSTPGTVRGSAAPQLPMQGGRSTSRNR